MGPPGVDAKPGSRVQVGVVSDTHGYLDPRLPPALAGVSVILHAGDVGSEDVLDNLRRIAPVHAIRGNVDGPELSLPLSAEFKLAGCRIEMVHILPFSQSELEALGQESPSAGGLTARAEKWLNAFKSETGLVIFGHTHSPCQVRLGRCLFFNPGAAGKKRFALPRSCGVLEISDGEISARLISLEPGSGLRGGKTPTKAEVFE